MKNCMCFKNKKGEVTSLCLYCWLDNFKPTHYPELFKLTEEGAD